MQSNPYCVKILLNPTVNISYWLNQWQDSRNTTNPVKEIQIRLKPLYWHSAAVPQCKGGLFLMKLRQPIGSSSYSVQQDHYPTTPEELNFHAELQAASQWWCSDDYNKL